MSKYANVDFTPLETAFLGNYELTADQIWAKNAAAIFEGVDSETVKYAALGASKGLSPWVGERQTKSLKAYSLNVTNVKYEDNFTVPTDAVRRDKLGLFANRAKDMAAKTQAQWNKLIVDLIVANGNAFDGVAFFHATGHKPDGTTSNVNVVTSSELAVLNVSAPATPTAAEAADVIIALIGQMQSFVDESGNVATQGARKFTIVTRTAAHFAAFSTAANVQYVASGTSNPVYNMLSKGYSIDVVLEPGIGGTYDLYMIRTDSASDKAFILQSENGIEFQNVIDPNDGFVAVNDAYLFGIKTNRGSGYGRPDYAIKATLV